MSEQLPRWLYLRQGVAVDEAAVPTIASEEFAAHVVAMRGRGGRISSLFARRLATDALRVYCLLAFDADSTLAICATDLAGANPSYPSITALWPAAQAFERAIAESYGVTPRHHPWLKPLRYVATDNGSPAPWGKFDPAKTIPGDYPFYRVEGEEVHEVAVGPIHAGVIEPGHFRFQCHGEDVLHLEIVLGYQHRGAQALLLHPNATRSALVAETIAGDATIGHALAYCIALEGLGGVSVGMRASAIRAIALELERLANHVGDLGALGLDIGFLPTSAYLGRLRGDFLNLTAEICGSRFGRNLLRPGGVKFDIDTALAEKIRTKLEGLQKETLEVLDLMFSTPSVLARFEGTGALTRETAEEIGLVGPAGRACGCPRDARSNHPHGIYQFNQLPLATETTGDVSARAVVRWLEVQRSLDFLLDILTRLPEGKTFAPLTALKSNALAIGLTETWRGEATYVAFSDAAGKVSFVQPKDPSMHNWYGLALALRNVAISDFPICNKSFSLSYCGHDL